MDFDFTDDQNSLRDAVGRWAEKSYGFERRRAITQSGGFSREAWDELAGLGLLGLALPEGSGGMGFGAVEAMVVMEELGRGMVLEPYAAVALVAAPLLAASKAACSPHVGLVAKRCFLYATRQKNITKGVQSGSPLLSS